jgi:acetyl esterase
MPVDPRLQPLLDAQALMPPLPEDLPPAELRALAHQGMEMGFLALMSEGPQVADVTDRTAAVEDGHITVRVYTPDGAGPHPAHLYIHGGGWFLGTLDQFDMAARAICDGAGCVVASVDYRLAPEHPFPTGAEDCYAALRWLVDNAAELNVDASRVSVGGGSAGGNLAAVVALMARDRGGPQLVFQVLEIPVTDLTLSHPSIEENAEGYMLTRAGMETAVTFYTPDPKDRTDPYASPLFAQDLSGLPPALVMTAEFDPLRDEGEAYAKRLEAAGVPTTLRRWEGQIHGSQGFDKVMPAEAKEYIDMVNTALRGAYGS